MVHRTCTQYLYTLYTLYTTISLPRALPHITPRQTMALPVHFRLFSVLFFLKLLP